MNVSVTYHDVLKDQKNTLPLLTMEKTNPCYNLSKESLELWKKAEEERTSCLLLLWLNGIN